MVLPIAVSNRKVLFSAEKEARMHPAKRFWDQWERQWAQWHGDLKIEWRYRHAAVLVREGRPDAEEAVLEACRSATSLKNDRLDDRKIACYLLAAGYYRGQRHFDRTEYFCFRALQTAGRYTPTDAHAKTLVFTGECYRHFGRFSLAEGRYDESLPVFREVHQCRETVFADTLHHLSRSYRHIDCPDKAETLLNEALVIYRDFNESGVELVRCLTGLGRLALERNKPDQAAAYLEEAALLAEVAHAAALPEVRLELGELYARQHRFSKAEQVLKEALDQAAGSDGRLNHLLGELTLKLGRLYLETGRPGEAGALLGRAGNLLRRRLGDDPELLALESACRRLAMQPGSDILIRNQRTLVRPPHMTGG